MKGRDVQQVKAEGGSEALKPAEVQCDWKEFTSPDNRKYYYNRVTKSSVWQMPEELKRAQALAAGIKPKAEGNSIQVCPALSLTILRKAVKHTSFLNAYSANVDSA